LIEHILAFNIFKSFLEILIFNKLECKEIKSVAHIEVANHQCLVPGRDRWFAPEICSNLLGKRGQILLSAAEADKPIIEFIIAMLR